MKGIILAGGSGTRLYPLTMAVSKQLVPVYDKPMIYYPLSILMEAGIREILIITTPHEQAPFIRLLGDGSRYGCRFEYRVQEKPNGLAEAFIIGKSFLGGESCCLILGDNIFHGKEMRSSLGFSGNGAKIFAYRVADPERYGVVEFDPSGKVISLVEKPTEPRSSYAVPGLYFYDGSASERAAVLRPSPRGELEITDLNRSYMTDERLMVETLERGTAWLDTGTFDSLMQASQFVQVIQERTGTMVGCIDEIAYREGFISREQLMSNAEELSKNSYGTYLKGLE